MKAKTGKIRTTTQENIALQKLFIERGYSFLNGRKEPHIRENLDFFFFDKRGIISVGSKEDLYNNSNPQRLKFWDGATNFDRKKVKEFKPNDFL